MIFIAKNYKGITIGIVSAQDKSSAIAYWQGANLGYNSIEEFDLSKDRENESLGYVTPLLKTKEVKDFNGTYIKVL